MGIFSCCKDYSDCIEAVPCTSVTNRSKTCRGRSSICYRYFRHFVVALMLLVFIGLTVINHGSLLSVSTPKPMKIILTIPTSSVQLSPAVLDSPVANGGVAEHVKKKNKNRNRGGKKKKGKQQRRGHRRKGRNKLGDVGIPAVELPITKAAAEPMTGAPGVPVFAIPSLQLPSVCPFQKVSGNEDCNSKQSFLTKPCLTRLKRPAYGQSLVKTETSSTIEQQAVLDSLVPPQVWRSLAKIPGDIVDPAHLTLIPFVTSLQWKHGVYGTIGQIGDVGNGKFTSLLARVVDTISGERLFVADPFVNEPLLKAPDDTPLIESNQQQPLQFAGMRHNLPDRHDLFVANVREATGFDEHSLDLDHRLYLYRGGLVNLARNLTSIVGALPLFRIIAFENLVVFSSSSETSPPSDTLVAAMEMAACILSEGGLVVLDGSAEALASTIETFMARNGRGSLAPLIHAGNKLYLTTADFRRQYYNNVVEAGDWMVVRLGADAVKMKKGEMAGFEILRL